MPKEPVLYEAMYILDATMTDEQIAATEARLKAGLEGEGAQVVSVHLFGRRRLAYEIKGHTEGIYRVMYFRGSGAAVDELKHELSLSEEVIRGQIVVANPRFMVADKPPAPPPAPAAEAAPEPEVPAETEVAPEAPSEVAVEEVAPAVEEPPAEVAGEEVAPPVEEPPAAEAPEA